MRSSQARCPSRGAQDATENVASTEYMHYTVALTYQMLRCMQSIEGKDIVKVGSQEVAVQARPTTRKEAQS